MKSSLSKVLIAVAMYAYFLIVPAYAGGCFRDNNGNVICCDDNGYCQRR